MENEATTKTPIPTRPGFRNFAFCILIFALPNPLSVRLFVPLSLSGQDPRSTLVEAPLQISSFLQNEPNSSKAKPNTTPFAAKVYRDKSPLATRRKRTQSNPNEPNVKIGKMKISTKISTEIVRVYANQQRTMNNERYPKQTQSNPIPPPPTNSLAQRGGGVFLYGIRYVVLD